MNDRAERPTGNGRWHAARSILLPWPEGDGRASASSVAAATDPSPTRRPRVWRPAPWSPSKTAPTPAPAPAAVEPIEPKRQPAPLHFEELEERTALAARTVMIKRWDVASIHDLFREREPGAIETRVAMTTAQARLVVGFVHAPQDVLIQTKLVTVGRSDGAQVKVPHPSVDPKHARIFWTGRRFVIEDLGSVNGIRVGDRLLRKGDRAQLRPHTALWIGGVPCLFLMRRLTVANGSDSIERPVRAELAIEQLERRGLISAYQGVDALTEERGAIDEIAARFIQRGVVTPEQWAEAYAAAAAVQLLRARDIEDEIDAAVRVGVSGLRRLIASAAGTVSSGVARLSIGAAKALVAALRSGRERLRQVQTEVVAPKGSRRWRKAARPIAKRRRSTKRFRKTLTVDPSRAKRHARPQPQRRAG